MSIFEKAHGNRTSALIDEIKPLDTTIYNGSFIYTYTSGNLTQIEWAIGGFTYRRTLTYDSSDNLTNMSVWVKQ